MSSKSVRLKSNCDRKCTNRKRLPHRRTTLLKEMRLGLAECMASWASWGSRTRCYRIDCWACQSITTTTSLCWVKMGQASETDKWWRIIIQGRLKINLARDGNRQLLSMALLRKNTTDYLKKNERGKKPSKDSSCAVCCVLVTKPALPKDSGCWGDRQSVLRTWTTRRWFLRTEQHCKNRYTTCKIRISCWPNKLVRFSGSQTKGQK